MLLRYLILILGFKPWEYKIPWYLDFYLMKKKITPNAQVVIKRHSYIIDGYSPSPISNIYVDRDYNEYLEVDKITCFKIIFYELWSMVIFGSLCIQPTYLIMNGIQNTNTRIEDITLAIIYTIIPVNYLWAKSYFSTNHFEKFFLETNWKCDSYCNVLVVICLLLSISSILPYVFFESHLNHYWSYNTFYLWSTFFILEIIGRNIVLINNGVFILTFLNHLKKINKTIHEIESSNIYDFNKFTILSDLILKFTEIKSELACSIECYNSLVSLSTAIGIVAGFLFMHHKLNTDVTVLTPQDYYTIVALAYYCLSELIFIIILWKYSYKRFSLYKYINSNNFISKYLSRTKNKKSTNKTQWENNLIIMEEESATTLDWVILDKITKENWIDFHILGISTRDGSLIKKVLTFSTIFYTLLKFF